jgi:hypothetical protein
MTTDAQVKEQIRERFARIARSPDSERVFPVGPASAKKLGYDAEGSCPFCAQRIAGKRALMMLGPRPSWASNARSSCGRRMVTSNALHGMTER